MKEGKIKQSKPLAEIKPEEVPYKLPKNWEWVRLGEMQRLATGIAIPGIGREDVLMQRFPLPPLAEQRRIVAKIDQIMARCDELEKLRVAAKNKQTELLNALMSQI